MSEYKGYDDTDKFIYEEIEDKPNWIYTYTGRKFSLTNPKPEQIHWDDLIIPLSRLWRSNCHVLKKYTVIQHLLLCVELAKMKNESPRILLLLSMHDLAESYCGDCRYSIMKSLIKDLFTPIEHKIEQAIYQHFGVEPPNKNEKEIIKIYDTKAFKYECHHLFNDDSWINDKEEDFSDIEIPVVSEDELIRTYKWVLIELLKQNGIDYEGE